MGLSKTCNSVWAFIGCVCLSPLLSSSLSCKVQSVQEKGSKSPIAVNVLSLTKVENTLKSVTYFGTLEPNRSRTLGFTVSGKIKTIAKRGQKAGPDELLVALEVSDFEEQKKSLQTRLSQAQSRQQFQQLQQQLSVLDEQIQTRRLLAPFDCVVDDVLAFENSLVRAQSPVLRILDTTKPRIKINLPRRVSERIQADLEVYFVIDDELVIGNLVERSQTEQAGSVFCWFALKQDLANTSYKFGQIVEARFNIRTGKSGFWVPLSALDRSGEGVWSLLLVETSNGASIVSRRLVTIRQLTDKQALIDGNVSQGALAVADGIHRVVPGQVVEPRLVKNESEAADRKPAK